MRALIGKLLCKIGFHKWGNLYDTASNCFGFSCGHARQDCQREGCTWVKNHWPS